MNMHFGVDGEGLTNILREMALQRGEVSKAMDYVVNMVDSDVSEEEKIGIAIKIIDGKAEFEGDTRVGLSLRETPDNPSLGLLDKPKKLMEKIKSLEEELHELYQKFNFLCDDARLTEYRMEKISEDYEEEYGKPMFPDIKKEKKDPMLESYLRRIKNERELDYDPDEDYGWLEPDGTFHPSPWGTHVDEAHRYIEERFEKEWKDTHRIDVKDFLVYEKGWVLLDSSFQGLPTATYDESRGLTKAQREFMYDHFMERGMNKEANALYEDEYER